MKIDEAVRRACEEPSLADALSWIAIWESERVVKQAHAFLSTGVPTGANGQGWDTFFKFCFERVFAEYERLDS